MNRGQLIVLWLTVLGICLAVLLAPRYVLLPAYERHGYYRRAAHDYPRLSSQIDWQTACQWAIPIGLVGAALIYTLRKPKGR